MSRRNEPTREQREEIGEEDEGRRREYRARGETEMAYGSRKGPRRGRKNETI